MNKLMILFSLMFVTVGLGGCALIPPTIIIQQSPYINPDGTAKTNVSPEPVIPKVSQGGYMSGAEIQGYFGSMSAPNTTTLISVTR